MNEQMIYTAKGLLPLSQLTVSDHITLDDNARVTATEWRMGDELVRRDVHVNLLRGLSMDGQQATL